MNTNLGTLDRYVRLVGGMMLISSALSMRRSMVKQAVMALGAMKVAEGAIGWCPIMHMVGVRDVKSAVQIGDSQNHSRVKGQTVATDAKDSSNRRPGEPASLARMDETHELKGKATRTENQGAQTDTPERDTSSDTMSPIEAHRILEGSEAVNTAYQ
jgi:hypothetical protein